MLYEVKESGIHNKGIFAKVNIPKGAKIIEYIGELISKEESERRADRALEAAQKDPSKGAVYIFELNDTHDIDGDVEYNTARLINHSCDPNCETEDDDAHIWIIAMRDIKAGEELTYNYGYDIDSWEDHPCKCGASCCVGYIVDEDHWPALKEELAKKKIAQG